MKNANQCNHIDLTVKYIGKRGRAIKLYLPEIPNDVEILVQLEDPAYQSEWKRAYLNMQYEEGLNNQRNERSEKREYLDTYTYEDSRYFSSNIGDPTRVINQIYDENLLEKIEPLLTKRQVEIMYRCLIGGASYVEVAKEEGKNEAAIRKTANQVKKKLKNFLEKGYDF